MWRELMPPLPPEHPVFAGHFPGRPIIPGAMLLDALFHAIGDGDLPGCVLLSAKFLKPVAPGEALQYEAEEISPGVTRFEIRASGRRAAIVSLRRAPGVR